MNSLSQENFQLTVARSFWSRAIGLLGRQSLAPNDGFLMLGCRSVHTHFMRFSIDVVFFDSRGVVLSIVEKLDPWCMAGEKLARHVLELPSGTAVPMGIRVGSSFLPVQLHLPILNRSV